MSAEKMQDVIMVIFDISGYTSFFVTNQRDLECAHAVLTDLIGAIIKEVRIPLRISKLEGDAVFAYAVKNGGEARWAEDKAAIRDRMGVLFRAFSARVRMLAETNSCGCNACMNVASLQLKAIIHSGRVFFQKIDRFCELSGPDVIILHRLLKNSIPGNEYILVTDAAWRDLGYAEEVQASAHEETYEHLGVVKGRVYRPPPDFQYAPTAARLRAYRSPAVRLLVGLYKSSVKTLIAWKVIKLRAYSHLPEVR